MPEALLKPVETQRRTGKGRSQMYTDIAKGLFPRPIKIGRNIFFIESEIDAWIRDRIAESRASDGFDTNTEGN